MRKTTRGLLAIMLAAIMTLGMIPTGVMAETVNGKPSAETETSGGKTWGELGVDTGTIEVGNPKLNETYTAYRLFELAAFEESTGSMESKEQSLSAGKHGQSDANEVYAYVIDENSPWFYFLTHYGPDGVSDG